eukprot:GHVP01002865.1.p1 GENE.GHVP01002865.1~~GHVP01002865.1.p1  ORF type:complete len:257 (-),score=53.73 GHVP01002865.1:43-813(-)
MELFNKAVTEEAFVAPHLSNQIYGNSDSIDEIIGRKSLFAMVREKFVGKQPVPNEDFSLKNPLQCLIKQNKKNSEDETSYSSEDKPPPPIGWKGTNWVKKEAKEEIDQAEAELAKSQKVGSSNYNDALFYIRQANSQLLLTNDYMLRFQHAEATEKAEEAIAFAKLAKKCLEKNSEPQISDGASVFQARMAVEETQKLTKTSFISPEAKKDLKKAKKYYEKAEKHLEHGKSTKAVSFALEAKRFADQAKQKIENCE